MSYRASPEGIFTGADEDGAITVTLLPFGTEKTYPSRAAARLCRCEPSLDSYDREIRFDTTSEFVKATIKSFFRRNVPIAPNKNTIAQRRHPLYPAQVERKQCMYRLETMNELWCKFVKESPEMAASITTPGKPFTAPMKFHTNAPWEMQKMFDEGCLCKVARVSII